MAKAFASTADLAEKKATFAKLADGIYAYTTEGDPNTGVIVGPDGVMVVDARATPVLAQELVGVIRTVTDKPVTHVVLTHYHAVRVMGASAYGAHTVIASNRTLALIAERGRQDFKSEVDRFPRLFQAVETVPGLTWPNLTFDRKLTLWWGKREIQILHLGKGHTKGDAVVWLPKERILFSGDLVEEGATPYCGDAYLKEWPATLDKLKGLRPNKLLPGRGEAMLTAKASLGAIAATQGFVRTMLAEVRKGAKAKKPLKSVFDAAHAKLKPKYGGWVIFEHCLPFNVSRAYDEARGIRHPRIWTAQRDKEMWRALQG
jgi:glyoxylase-like metal-dependent hydrolase (beta-lactamase superfamily II)